MRHTDECTAANDRSAQEVCICTPDTNTKNRETERREIQWLQTGPDKVFLYVHMPHGPTVGQSRSFFWTHGDHLLQTWLSHTPVATHVYIGPRRMMGFHGSYRRPVTCRLYGVRYHGWYYESSGDYCRLTRAKRQN